MHEDRTETWLLVIGELSCTVTLGALGVDERVAVGCARADLASLAADDAVFCGAGAWYRSRNGAATGSNGEEDT